MKQHFLSPFHWFQNTIRISTDSYTLFHRAEFKRYSHHVITPTVRSPTPHPPPPTPPPLLLHGCCCWAGQVKDRHSLWFPVRWIPVVSPRQWGIRCTAAPSGGLIPQRHSPLSARTGLALGDVHGCRRFPLGSLLSRRCPNSQASSQSTFKKTENYVYRRRTPTKSRSSALDSLRGFKKKKLGWKGRRSFPPQLLYMSGKTIYHLFSRRSVCRAWGRFLIKTKFAWTAPDSGTCSGWMNVGAEKQITSSGRCCQESRADVWSILKCIYKHFFFFSPWALLHFFFLGGGGRNVW